MSGTGLTLAAKGVATLSGIGTVVLTTWMTVVAFVGGTMPIIGWETDGGLATGILWLFVVDPIVVSACWLLTTVVVLPILAVGDSE
ncbi:hypothetical protein [Actinomarinicola tropica]|uniref:Uncharacterized protein n=1 Tax=Actinomarinicola tropica TaxID=2789776 RepID=A0A5Q2RC12_9ACTN|nr:hypothetical protein [Actinomarinicola tropica]QGG94378.1 hypothetical protein GH723_04255 [Actinomarinicola tropica]